MILKTNHNTNKAQKSNTQWKIKFESIQTFYETKNLVNIWLDKT